MYDMRCRVRFRLGRCGIAAEGTGCPPVPAAEVGSDRRKESGARRSRIFCFIARGLYL
jgi:hypothetical protein